jgi:predicted ester cyclase
MSIEANKALSRRWFEEIDRLNDAIVDELLADDYVDHTPLPVPGLAHGREGVKQVFEMNRVAFTDAYHTIEDQVAEGDLVVTRVLGGGIHTGPFLGIPPTNKHVQMRGTVMHRIRDGKIAEHWAVIDALSLLQQLNPAPDTAAPEMQTA